MRHRFVAVVVLACVSLAAAQDRPPAKKPGSAPELVRDLAPPLAIRAAGKPINVDIGHAAPCVADFASDGVMHLLVGQFGDGKLRIYRNEGTKAEPKFGKFTWFMAGGAEARIPSG
jgi:hypothetical protein